MTLAFNVRVEAQSDIEEVAVWYEQRAAGLGDSFLTELDDLFSRIVAMPRQFPEIEEGFHRSLLRRFPYAVYFSLRQYEIVVFAVLHIHRHPESWKQRQIDR